MKKFGLLLCLLTLTACASGNQNYENAVSSGVNAVAKGQYQQAQAFFQTAENQQKTSAITAYQEQVLYLENATEKSERGDLASARKDLQALGEEHQLSRSFEQAQTKINEEIKAKEKTITQIDDQVTGLEKDLQAKKAAEAKEKILSILKLDLSPTYLREQRLKFQQLQQNYFDLVQEQVSEATTSESENAQEKEAAIVPKDLQDVWYNPLSNQDNADYDNPALKLTESTLYFYYNDQEYKITSVTQQDNTYTLYWDLNDLVKRYGNAALGDNPLPFQVVLTEATERYPYKVLKMGESTFYSEP